MRFAIYDPAGRITHQVRGSAAHAALNTPAGYAALEIAGDVVDQERVYVDLAVAPTLAARPDDLGVDAEVLLSALATLVLPEDALVTAGAFEPVLAGEGGEGLGDLAAEIAAVAEPGQTWPLTIECFPSVTHRGRLVADPAP